ncbi:coiled-coil domain-containing protein 171 [Discoglossus pictus]
MDRMMFISQNHPTSNELGSSQQEHVDMDKVLELRCALNKVKNEKVELMAKQNEELSILGCQVIKLRSEVEKGEAERQRLEYELAVLRKQCSADRMALEEEKQHSLRLQGQCKVQIEELHKKEQEMKNKMESVIQSQNRKVQELQKKLHELQTEKNIHTEALGHQKSELEYTREREERLKGELESQNKRIQELHKQLYEMEAEKNVCMDNFLHQKNELGYSREREERLIMELETATQRVKRLEENIESERAAHLESKFNSEVIQLRIRDLESSLQVEKASYSQSASDLEMIKNQFREVEAAYNREKKRADSNAEKLKKAEQESSILTNQLKSDIDKKSRMVSDLTVKLKSAEENYIKIQQDFAEARKRHSNLEDSYGSNMRELQSMVESFNVSSQRTSGSYKDKVKAAGPAAVLETLRHTLTDYQSRLEGTSNELETTKRLCWKMSEELESSKQKTQSLCNNLENTQSDLGEVRKELNHLRSKYAEKESQIGTIQKDLEKTQHGWEKEKLRVTEAENEIQKLTRTYQKDTEEKLTFLHNLYQRLVAGCVLIKQPESMLGKFSWPELCIVLQENVDVLISDLNRANEKASHLEYVSKNKTDTLRELQKNHEDSLNKLAAEMKAQDSSWQKQRRDLEQHYNGLLGEVQARAQKFQSIAEKSKDTVAVFEKTKDQVALENVHVKNLLMTSEKDLKSLLAAYALMAGALYPLYGRYCCLLTQRDFLLHQFNTYVEAHRDIRTLVQALSETDEKVHFGYDKIKRKDIRGLKNLFRKSVIVVLAANRLQRLGKSSNALFSWVDNMREGKGMLVYTGRTKGKQKRSSQQDEHKGHNEVWKWFSNTDLLSSAVSSVSDLRGVLITKDPNSQTYGNLINSARNSFAKLMNKLRDDMENPPDERYGVNINSDSLMQRLAYGLQKHNPPSSPSSFSTMKCVSTLKKQIFGFTQRLHSTEVERRSLRLELTEFKEKISELQKSAGSAEDLNRNIQLLKHSKVVPYEKFISACEELKSALLREQQAQALLSEQSQQLIDLNYKLEMHADEETEKEQTLTEAVKGLSEAKLELRRKDQSLRQLTRQLGQLEQDKNRLEESIHNAESALRMAAKDKETLTNHMKSVEVILQKVRDQISLSWSAAISSDFTLHLPKLHPEIFAMEGYLGGPEFKVCQSMIRSFMDVYHLAWSKTTALEREITSHKKHIAALKSELQTACLRENASLTPINYDHDIPLHTRSASLLDKTTKPDFFSFKAEEKSKKRFMKYSYETSRSYSSSSSAFNDSTSPIQTLPNGN